MKEKKNRLGPAGLDVAKSVHSFFPASDKNHCLSMLLDVPASILKHIELSALWDVKSN